MSRSASLGVGTDRLLILDVALILCVRPGDLVCELQSAGYPYKHALQPISFMAGEQILQRFESQSLRRPRHRDPVGAAIPESRRATLVAQQKHKAELAAQRLASALHD